MIRFRENEEERLRQVKNKLDANQRFGDVRYRFDEDDVRFLVALVDALRIERGIADRPRPSGEETGRWD